MFKDFYRYCEFRREKSIEERFIISNRLKNSNENCFPSYILNLDEVLNVINSIQFMIYYDMTAFEVINKLKNQIKDKFVIREHLHLYVWDPKTDTCSFLPNNQNMGELYNEYKDKDNFLYIYMHLI